MKIVIPGGSGQIGMVLARAFHGDGQEVVVLSRDPMPAPWRVVAWDGETLSDWARCSGGVLRPVASRLRMISA